MKVSKQASFSEKEEPSSVPRAEVQMKREDLRVVSWATWGTECPSKVQGLKTQTVRRQPVETQSNQRQISARGDHSSPWTNVGFLGPTKAVSLEIVDFQGGAILLVNGGKERVGDK